MVDPCRGAIALARCLSQWRDERIAELDLAAAKQAGRVVMPCSGQVFVCDLPAVEIDLADEARVLQPAPRAVNRGEVDVG